MRPHTVNLVAPQPWSSAGPVPPWNKQQNVAGRSMAFTGQASVIPSPQGRVEEAYEPMQITHETVRNTGGLFCLSCRCPMEIKVRLEPCYHLVCLVCLNNDITKKQKCPGCQKDITLATAVKPEDQLAQCSGKCNPSGQPRTFLNVRSLRCHEMFFHPEDGEAEQSNCPEVDSHMHASVTPEGALSSNVEPPQLMNDDMAKATPPSYLSHELLPSLTPDHLQVYSHVPAQVSCVHQAENLPSYRPQTTSDQFPIHYSTDIGSSNIAQYQSADPHSGLGAVLAYQSGGDDLEDLM